MTDIYNEAKDTSTSAIFNRLVGNKTNDYDYLGYQKEYNTLEPLEGGHYPDTYKLPNHITFSDQSKYSTKETPGGKWSPLGPGQWQFEPSEHNLKHHSLEDYADYFVNREKKGTFIRFPNGIRLEGTQ